MVDLISFGKLQLNSCALARQEIVVSACFWSISFLEEILISSWKLIRSLCQCACFDGCISSCNRIIFCHGRSFPTIVNNHRFQLGDIHHGLQTNTDTQAHMIHNKRNSCYGFANRHHSAANSCRCSIGFWHTYNASRIVNFIVETNKGISSRIKLHNISVSKLTRSHRGIDLALQGASSIKCKHRIPTTAQWRSGACCYMRGRSWQSRNAKSASISCNTYFTQYAIT